MGLIDKIKFFLLNKTPRKMPKFNDKKEKKKWLCSTCQSNLDLLTDFTCVFCKMEFCEKHRLPEYHACSGNPKLPDSMKQCFESWTFPK